MEMSLNYWNPLPINLWHGEGKTKANKQMKKTPSVLIKMFFLIELKCGVPSPMENKENFVS